ncbi:MAG: hypothetical protein E6H78_06915 [Betaproteobacteria bacterium]|nr:MAG: hypothetical protein E6H78_06915 [Betaproteobacteria bacterium]
MAPNRLNAQWLRLTLATLALGALAILSGCGGGSGAPNNPFAPPPTTPGPLSILPAAPTVFSNTPATLTITGGVPPYAVFSSNTAVLPIGASITSGTIVLLPGNVLADTVVAITAQDSAGTKVSTNVTVKPAPIFNTLTVTPASAACGTNAVCSGQTATAKVIVTGAGGVGLPNRQVRFDVVAGAFAIESNDPANPLVSTLTVVSDQFGVAQVIIQASASAPTQPALLRATELTTGNQQTAQFTIVQTINGAAVLSVVPATATITGPDNTQCSTGFRIDYFIYGGTPPYRISSTFPTAVTLLNSTVLASGQPFSVITNGTCVNPLVFSIVDAIGLQTTATLNNVLGTIAPPTAPPPALVANPSSQTVTCASLSSTFSVLITGGTAPYSVSGSTVNGSTPIVTPQPLDTPGFVAINNMVGPGTYNFIVADAGTPQQTDSFRIVCS